VVHPLHPAIALWSIPLHPAIALCPSPASTYIHARTRAESQFCMPGMANRDPAAHSHSSCVSKTGSRIPRGLRAIPFARKASRHLADRRSILHHRKAAPLLVRRLT